MPEAERYLARLSNGLCVACGTSENEDGRTQCGPCAVKAQKLNVARRERLRLKKLCAKCGHASAAQTKRYCERCLRYFAAATAARKRRTSVAK